MSDAEKYALMALVFAGFSSALSALQMMTACFMVDMRRSLWRREARRPLDSKDPP